MNTVIFGCGDLGQRYIAQAANDETVIGIRRSPAAHCRSADLDNLSDLQRQLPEQVSLAICTLKPTEMSETGYQQGFVERGKTILNALKDRNCQRLLFVTSTAVYRQNHGEWVDEESTTDPQSYNGRQLRVAEQQMIEGATAMGIEATMVRFAGIYGPGRTRLIKKSQQPCRELPLSWGNRIHADDCAAVLQFLGQHPQTLQSLYLGSDTRPSLNAEVLTWLAQQQGLTHRFPELGEASGKRCSNQRLQDLGFQFRYPTYQEGYQQVLAAMGLLTRHV